MRDFRGAKAMARALRDALKTKAIESTHTEALEPIAKSFGHKNWNILSAKIEAAERTLSDERSLSASSAAAPTESQEVRETALRPSGGVLRRYRGTIIRLAR
jgi:Glyoxalase superfamily protein